MTTPSVLQEAKPSAEYLPYAWPVITTHVQTTVSYTLPSIVRPATHLCTLWLQEGQGTGNQKLVLNKGFFQVAVSSTIAEVDAGLSWCAESQLVECT